jgi:hypothetical protein
LVPVDAKEAMGHGLRARRSKSGAISFDFLDVEAAHAPLQCESVAALASALAKAQAELINPEKSLTARIRSTRAGEADRIFRYAPLSSGLDIVRKALGQHEIATVQTTAVDQATGMVKLTTMPAHASGEWIASDWPVCPIAEMASTQRMGAALTYACRYALGIAGEDDLDAPDVHAEAASPPGPVEPPHPARTSGNGHARGTIKVRTPVLGPVESSALREKLLSELASIASTDLAESWARGALAAKNKLVAAVAKLVEDAFEQRLFELVPSKTAGSPNLDCPVNQIVDQQATGTTASIDGDQPKDIKKSVVLVAAPRRYRNKAHLQYVAQQACLLCGRKPSDPHHLRFMQLRALGRKVSDEFTVPLCRGHHRAVNRSGDERAWWKENTIDPVAVARKLWKRTRQDGSPSRGVEKSVMPSQHDAG